MTRGDRSRAPAIAQTRALRSFDCRPRCGFASGSESGARSDPEFQVGAPQAAAASETIACAKVALAAGGPAGEELGGSPRRSRDFERSTGRSHSCTSF